MTGSDDLTARLWDVETGRCWNVSSKDTRNSVHVVAFSPDGRRAITTSEDYKVRLWNVETGEQTIVLLGHDCAVWSAAFSPDGERVLTASDDGTARVWDVQTGDQAVAVLRAWRTSEERHIQP